MQNIIFIIKKTSYLNEEVNRTEPSPQLVFPVATEIENNGKKTLSVM
jgi:hypothetical protein